MGLRLISIPTVGGIDICKSQFGNPQERSIYYQYELFVRSIVFHLRQLGLKRLFNGLGSCSSSPCLFRSPFWLPPPGIQVRAPQSRLLGQDFCIDALICKLCTSFRWYMNDFSLSMSRLHKG